MKKICDRRSFVGGVICVILAAACKVFFESVYVLPGFWVHSGFHIAADISSGRIHRIASGKTRITVT